MLQTTLEKITLHVIESTPCRQRSLEIKFLGGKGIPTFSHSSGKVSFPIDFLSRKIFLKLFLYCFRPISLVATAMIHRL
jgi:hypothetical protein